MPRVAEPGIRYRISVPEQDAGVHEWIRNQLNLSMSLRMLIKDDIHRNGYSDVTCRVERELPKIEDVAQTPAVPKANPIFQTHPVEASVSVKGDTDKRQATEVEKPSLPFQSVGNPSFSAAAMGLLDD
jgi:hypothetical protein